MNVENNNLKQKVWDLGPTRPEAPVAPVAPLEAEFKGKTAVADLAVAQIQFEDALVDYKTSLRNYAASRTAYDKWRSENGGPVELEMWSFNAREALARDPARYSRSLPKDAKPGRTHEANQRSAEQRLVEDAVLARKDPHFGEGLPA